VALSRPHGRLHGQCVVFTDLELRWTHAHAQGIAFSLLLIRVREERRSRLIRRMSEAVDVPLPRRSHAVELPYKLGNL
jgi:hypothetical protein